MSSSPEEVRNRARAVRLAIFDVDGVMTDGTLYIGESGEVMKAFNILDGHGLKMLQATGVATALLSGRVGSGVSRRAHELAIGHVLQGIDDKVAAFERLRGELRLERESCAYMGDDLPDLGVMRLCGLAAAPDNAVEAVKAAAHYVTRARGGGGAVRELCELVLAAQGRLAAPAGG